MVAVKSITKERYFEMIAKAVQVSPEIISEMYKNTKKVVNWGYLSNCYYETKEDMLEMKRVGIEAFKKANAITRNRNILDRKKIHDKIEIDGLLAKVGNTFEVIKSKDGYVASIEHDGRYFNGYGSTEKNAINNVKNQIVKADRKTFGWHDYFAEE